MLRSLVGSEMCIRDSCGMTCHNVCKDFSVSSKWFMGASLTRRRWERWGGGASGRLRRGWFWKTLAKHRGLERAFLEDHLHVQRWQGGAGLTAVWLDRGLQVRGCWRRLPTSSGEVLIMINDQNLSGAYGEPVMVLYTGCIVSSSQQP